MKVRLLRISVDFQWLDVQISLKKGAESSYLSSIKNIPAVLD